MLISKPTLRAPTFDSTLHYQCDCFYTSPTYNKSLNIFVWILPFHFQVRIMKWLFHSFHKRKDIFRRSGWDSKNLPTVLCSYRVMKGLWAQALVKREVSGILSLPLKLCADSRRLLNHTILVLSFLLFNGDNAYQTRVSISNETICTKDWAQFLVHVLNHMILAFLGLNFLSSKDGISLYDLQWFSSSNFIG